MPSINHVLSLYKVLKGAGVVISASVEGALVTINVETAERYRDMSVGDKALVNMGLAASGALLIVGSGYVGFR
jgi:hypothetical protein